MSVEITYDARGSATYDGHFTYTWDAQTLIEAHNSVAKFEFGYDSEGRRICKKSYGWVNNDWQLGQHLVFAYDGWNLMAEFVVVGNRQQLYRSYAWGPGPDRRPPVHHRPPGQRRPLLRRQPPRAISLNS